MKLSEFSRKIKSAWRSFFFYPVAFLTIGALLVWNLPERWEVHSVIAPPVVKSFGLESPANLAVRLRSIGTLSVVAKVISEADGGQKINEKDVRSALRITVNDKFVDVRVEASSPQLGVLISRAMLEEVNRQERDYIVRANELNESRRELAAERLKYIIGKSQGTLSFDIPITVFFDEFLMGAKTDLSKFLIEPSHGGQPNYAFAQLLLVIFFIIGIIIAVLRTFGSDLDQ